MTVEGQGGGCSKLGEFAENSTQLAFYSPPPSPSHQTPRHYNHLILHHYRLSNFIKPHTWFWLCCSATAFQPCHFSEFYCAGIEVNRACAQLAVSALCRFSMCSPLAIFPRRESHRTEVTFSGRPVELGHSDIVLALALSAVLWNTLHFIRGR